MRSPAPSSGSSPEKLFLITVPSQEQGLASREGVEQVGRLELQGQAGREGQVGRLELQGQANREGLQGQAQEPP